MGRRQKLAPGGEDQRLVLGREGEGGEPGVDDGGLGLGGAALGRQGLGKAQKAGRGLGGAAVEEGDHGGGFVVICNGLLAPRAQAVEPGPVGMGGEEGRVVGKGALPRAQARPFDK